MLCCFVVNGWAQTSHTENWSASPILNDNGAQYQAYCISLGHEIPTANLNYNHDSSPENGAMPTVLACLQGEGTYTDLNLQLMTQVLGMLLQM